MVAGCSAAKAMTPPRWRGIIHRMTRTQALFLKHLGTSLMVLSVLFVLYVLAPFTPWWPQPTIDIENVQYSIHIPKITATAPIILNVDAWNESAYKPKLKQGVAHAVGTPLPGDPGTSFLFAHSSDWPWNITRYNTAFFKLNQLQIGDTITIYRNQQPMPYVVSDKKVVWPRQSEFLDSPDTQIILQTCTPIGTAYKRLLIFARPV